MDTSSIATGKIGYNGYDWIFYPYNGPPTIMLIYVANEELQHVVGFVQGGFSPSIMMHESFDFLREKGRWWWWNSDNLPRNGSPMITHDNLWSLQTTSTHNHYKKCVVLQTTRHLSMSHHKNYLWICTSCNLSFQGVLFSPNMMLGNWQDSQICWERSYLADWGALWIGCQVPRWVTCLESTMFPAR